MRRDGGLARLAPGRVYTHLRFLLRQRRRLRDGLRVARALQREHGDRVLHGPFAGMVYRPAATWGETAPRYLGIYERELHGVIGEITGRAYRQVADVGCAEGYYAVGLALGLPEARVTAWDVAAEARRACARLAVVNGVADRVEVRGRCGPRDLEALAADGPLLVLSDCEGGEADLLDPEAAPGLRRADILVELHPHIVADVAARMQERFGGSHAITRIPWEGRDPDEVAEASIFIDFRDRRMAVEEGRVEGMEWWWMEARRV